MPSKLFDLKWTSVSEIESVWALEGADCLFLEAWRAVSPSTYLNPSCSLCLHLCSSSALPWTWHDSWKPLCRAPGGKGGGHLVTQSTTRHEQRVYCHRSKTVQVIRRIEARFRSSHPSIGKAFKRTFFYLEPNKQDRNVSSSVYQQRKNSLYPHFMLLSWHQPGSFPTALPILQVISGGPQWKECSNI